MFPIPFNFPFRKKDGSITTMDAAIAGGGTPYTLPTASAETKGGVKIGSGLTMDGETLNNSNPTPYSLPTASAETKGGVKIGSGLTMDGETLNAAGFTIDRENLRVIFESDNDAILYSDLKVDVIGTVNYEVKTKSTTSPNYSIDVYMIDYVDGEPTNETLLATLSYQGTTEYNDGKIYVYKSGAGQWNIIPQVAFYKEDGTTWAAQSVTSWTPTQTVDYILLKESPV